MKTTKTNPTLLEIATNFALWQEYADPSGIDSEEQFNERSESENLQILQACGYGEAYRGNMYDSSGHLIAENLLIEIEPAGGTADVPTIVIGCTPHRTQDFRDITSGSLTGPGGWYVIVRSVEGGEE